MKEPSIDRTLIEAARDGLGPTDEERRRLLKRTLVGVASAAAASSAGAASGAASIAAWKVVAVGLIGVGVAVAGGVEWQESSEAEGADSGIVVPARATPSSERPAPTEDVAPPDVAPPDVAPPVMVAPADMANMVPAELGVAPRSRARRAARRTPLASTDAPDQGPTSDPEPRPDTSLEAETALLRTAHRALQGGQPARALALLESHRERFPEAVLREEVAAAHVLALCAANREAEARTEAARFLVSHPNSMQSARVRASCAGD